MSYFEIIPCNGIYMFKFTLFIVFFSFVINNLLASKRPNILFVFADDWGRHASICSKIDGAGTVNDYIRTPNFDAIAKSGVLFNHAFVNSPSCTPCRSSLLSGQHFWRTDRGSILQGAVWDDSIPVWPLLLQKNGYHIGYTWKVWSPGNPKNAPYGAWNNSFSKSGSRYNKFSQVATELVNSGNNFETVCEELLAEVTGNFNHMINAKDEDQPFAYWFGPTNVHRKWVKGSGLNLWGLNPDTLKGKLLPFLPDVPEVREDFADYLGEVMAFDLALGALIKELKSSGHYENTLIIVSGDHGPAGFPNGKCNLYDFRTRVALAVSGLGVNRGRSVDDFVSLPDLAPTILSVANIEIPEVMTGKSIWKTLKSNQAGYVDRSRSHVLIGRERHVAIARKDKLPYPQRAIRNKDYLYIINFKPDTYPMGDHYRLGGKDELPKDKLFKKLLLNTMHTIPDIDAGPTKAWIVMNRNNPNGADFFNNAFGKRPYQELYDLKSDPHQTKNVASHKKYEKVINLLHNKLMKELKDTGDPRVIDDGNFFETPPLSG